MRKNIFVDGRVFDTEYQGTRTYIQNLYSLIDQMGDLEIFLASKDPENAAGFFPKSQNIKFLKYESESKLKRVFIDIPQLIKNYKIDTAHFQYVIAPLKRTRQIVTIHDILFKDFPADFSLSYRLIKSLTFHYSAIKADVITTVSEYSKQAICKHFNVPAKNVYVVPNGVADFYFERYNKEEKKQEIFSKFGIKNYILYVSRVEPRKNQVDLLKSYIDLKLYNFKRQLVFIGKQSLQVKELSEILQKMPQEIKNNIFFFENISDSDLRSIYQASDVFVYPSKAEGFGIPPLEAAALQIPTICSNTTAMEDFNFFGKNHIRPEEYQIKEALTNLNENVDQDGLEQISNTIKIQYSWIDSAKKLNKIILEK